MTTLRAANYPNGVAPVVAIPGCAAAAPVVTTAPVVVVEDKSKEAAAVQMKGYGMTNGAGALILWFILIFIVVWLIMYGLKPDIIKNNVTGEIDTGKLILATFVVSLVIIIIIWLIKLLVGRKG